MVEVTLDDYKTDLKSVSQYPIPFIQNNSVIKLKESETEVVLGVKSSLSIKLGRQLKQLHQGKSIIFVKLKSAELTSYLSKLSSNIGTDDLENYEKNDLTKLANDAPIINLVNSILIDGINKGASDIHIEGYREEVHLRYRIDGVLVEADSINKSNFAPLSSRIKIISGLNIMERRKPQDGRTSVVLEGVNVDLRVSIVPLSEGESIVLRLFIKKEIPLTLEDLGYRGKTLKNLNSVSTLAHGLILVTGPTGSGKTTTLNALLQKVNSRDKKIITIEDPVEYSLEGINQIQINNDIDLGFNAILRRVLRQDPDIIMIGEIRDRETAELVIRAALTGHLVLSTLHTNDAVGAISRLRDLEVPDYLITSVLKASFAQRLVRVVCKSCGGEGCHICSNTGYKGRTVVAEGFVMDNNIESLILDQAKPHEFKSYLNKTGIESILDSGKKLVEQDITTASELMRVV